MSDQRKGKQHDRLRIALRENLKRRKAQAKGRAVEASGTEVGDGSERPKDGVDTRDTTERSGPRN